MPIEMRDFQLPTTDIEDWGTHPHKEIELISQKIADGYIKYIAGKTEVPVEELPLIEAIEYMMYRIGTSLPGTSIEREIGKTGRAAPWKANGQLQNET